MRLKLYLELHCLEEPQVDTNLLLIKFLIHLKSGTDEFDPFETQFVTRRPRTMEEELVACKEKLVVARKELLIANQKLKGIVQITVTSSSVVK